MGRAFKEFIQGQENNKHYSEQSGHQARGAVNKALMRARSQGHQISKGELSYVSRRFMMRDPKSGK